MSSAPSDATINDLVDAFTELGPAWVRWVNLCLPAENLSFARMRVLTELFCEGDLTMSDLAIHLDVSPRRVTDLVDALVADGFVVRKANPRDARSTLVAITPAGATQHQIGWEQHRTAVGVAFTDLSVRQREQLLTISRALTAAVHERLEPGHASRARRRDGSGETTSTSRTRSSARTRSASAKVAG